MLNDPKQTAIAQPELFANTPLPPPQKATESMCDRDFDPSKLDLETLKAQDPIRVFWAVWHTKRLPVVRSHENEAIEKTAIWFVKHFVEFDPKYHRKDFPNASLMDCLVAWIRSHLYERLKDLRDRRRGVDDSFYYHNRKVINPKTGKEETTRSQRTYNASVREGEDGELLTLLNLIGEDGQLETRSHTNRCDIFSRLESAEVSQVGDVIKNIIINDPDDGLRKLHLKKRPNCNCKDILERLHIRAESLTTISKDLGESYHSINTLLNSQGYPHLAKIALSNGYEPETIRKAVLEDRKEILKKAFIKKPDRMPETNAQFLAMQFLSAFASPLRSPEDVTRELCKKYGYRLSTAVLESFWQNEGLVAVAKAVRAANVNKRDEV
jgi:hypothetical protein